MIGGSRDQKVTCVVANVNFGSSESGVFVGVLLLRNAVMRSHKHFKFKDYMYHVQ